MNNPYNRPSYQPPYGYAPMPFYQQEPYRKPLRRWANVIGGGMLMVQLVMAVVYYLLYLAFSLIDHAALRYETWDLIEQASQVTAYVLGFWVPILFIATMIRIPWNVAFPMRRPRASLAIPAIFICLGASMLGSILSNMLSYTIETVFDVVPIMPEMPIPEGIAANVVYILSMTLLPAIFEEMMFRGVILQSLRRFGDGFAIITSAILFGMCHNNLVQGPNAFIMGLVIGYFVVRTGSLLTGMLIHFVNNGLAVVFTYMAETMTDTQYEMLNLGVFYGYIVISVAALIFIAVRHGNLFRVAPSDYPLPPGKKFQTFFLAATVILCILSTVLFTIPNFE